MEDNIFDVISAEAEDSVLIFDPYNSFLASVPEGPRVSVETIPFRPPSLAPIEDLGLAVQAVDSRDAPPGTPPGRNRSRSKSAGPSDRPDPPKLYEALLGSEPKSASIMLRNAKRQSTGRTRSNAAPTISKSKDLKYGISSPETYVPNWAKIDWGTLPSNSSQFSLVKDAGDTEMNRLRNEMKKYKLAFEKLFKEVKGHEPSPLDVEPPKPQIPFGTWLVSLDPKKIRVIQRTWRKYKQRQKFPREFLRSEAATPIRHRNEVVREILMTEKAYVDSLRIICHEWKPRIESAVAEGKLRGAKEDLTSLRAAAASIFGNITSILSYNTEILSQLQTEFNKWPGSMSIGTIFVDMAPYLRMYSQYVNNYNKAIETLARIERTTNYKQVVAQIQKTRPLCRMGLEMLLISPVQRIPRYELLLKQLFKLTPAEHKDHGLLPEAIKCLSETAAYINEEKRSAESKEALYMLQRKIAGCPDLIGVSGRSFVHKGKLTIQSNRLSAVFKNKRTFYLFSDMLMISNSTLSGVIYDDSTELTNCQVIDQVDDCQFVLLFLNSGGRPRRRMVIVASTPATKAEWLTLLNRHINVAKGMLGSPMLNDGHV